MACETILKPRQSIQERIDEVRRTVSDLSAGIAAGIVEVKVGAQGAVTFVGWSDEDRNGVSDACAYRRLIASGSARAAIAKAEQLAGRTVDRVALARGVHSHDGGKTWHGKDRR